MLYLLIIICLIISVMSLIIYLRTSLKSSVENKDKSSFRIATNKQESLDEFLIQVELLPSEYNIDDNKLIEITDRKVLSRVSNLIPGLVQVGNVANNAFQAAQTNGEVLYRAILPAGAKLSDSKEMGGAVRGLYHEANGIKGHANLIAVEAQKGTAVIANTVAAAMGIASMVVGQYYMTQINNELSEINDNIAKISDFQDNEYRSKVFSLMTHVKKIADFQSEILDNNESNVITFSACNVFLRALLYTDSLNSSSLLNTLGSSNKMLLDSCMPVALRTFILICLS